jgi:site-specific DNA recombinase
MPDRARPRVALYLRLSERTDESTSITRQEEDLRAHAEREGWDVVDVLVDDGISGRRARAKADEAIRRLRSGDVDVLAVWKFDRFSRQGLGALASLIEALDARPEARFVALRDGLSSDAPAWRIVASVLAEVARMEAENTSARVRSSVAALRRSGRFAGGTPPIGYMTAPNPDGPGRILVPHPKVAPLLQDVAERIVRGDSVYSVTRRLNDSGVKPPRAKSWSIQAVTQALSGHSVVGRVKVGGELLRDDEGAPVPVWEPLLSLDTWYAVRAALEARKAARSPVGQRVSSRSRLLSGIAACAHCDAPLYVRGGTDRATIYSCGARSNGRTCPGVAVTAELLERYVADEVLGIVKKWPVLVPVESEAPAVALAEAEHALREIAERLADAALSDAEEDRLLARRRALRDRVRTLRAEAPSGEVEFRETGETMGDVWERSDVLRRRELLSSALTAVFVSKGKRGAHGLDTSRVELVWTHDSPDGAAAGSD